MIKAKEIGKDEKKVLTIKELVQMNDAYRENQLTMFKIYSTSNFDILTAQLIYERSQ